MGERKKYDDDEGQIATEEEVVVKKPNLYRVLLLNDDYTPMEFVVWVLQNIFHKPHDESVRLMLDVHTKGSGLCGVYPFDVAQTKVNQVKNTAQGEGHPLECIMEIESS